MTDKIIEAARLAGATRAYPEAQSTRDDAYLVGQQFLERFYAIARAEALEDAAKVATQIDLESQGVLPIRVALISSRIAKSILALKDHDAAIAAGKGEA